MNLRIGYIYIILFESGHYYIGKRLLPKKFKSIKEDYSYMGSPKTHKDKWNNPKRKKIIRSISGSRKYVVEITSKWETCLLYHLDIFNDFYSYNENMGGGPNIGVFTKEHRLKISESHKKLSFEKSQRMKEYWKNNPQRKLQLAKIMRKNSSNQKQTLKQRKQSSERLKKLWQDPDYRKKKFESNSKQMTRQNYDPEFKRKNLKARRKKWDKNLYLELLGLEKPKWKYLSEKYSCSKKTVYAIHGLIKKGFDWSMISEGYY